MKKRKNVTALTDNVQYKKNASSGWMQELPNIRWCNCNEKSKWKFIFPVVCNRVLLLENLLISGCDLFQ